MAAESTSRYVEPPYLLPKVVFDFYFNEPLDIQDALYWIRSLANPLGESPYSYKLDDMSIIVIIHGTEVVTVARKNYGRYKDIVERMRYYASFGVKFRVCGLNAGDYGYDSDDFYDFIEVVPTAMAELTHWQQKGYAVIKPDIKNKKYSIQEIR
jgi:intracellular sulfur oxidation DsrE/DsrF family protein